MLPAVLVTYYKRISGSEEKMIEAMYVAAGIGQIIANRAYLAGSVRRLPGGDRFGSGWPRSHLLCERGKPPADRSHACAMALKNLMGLVCDPVGGLVEVPCVKRNVGGAVNCWRRRIWLLPGSPARSRWTR